MERWRKCWCRKRDLNSHALRAADFEPDFLRLLSRSAAFSFRHEPLHESQPLDEAGNVSKARIASKQFVASQPRERNLEPRAYGGSAYEIGIHAIRRGLIHLS